MKKLILPSLLAALCIAASPAPIYRNWSTTNLNPIVTSNQIADKTITGAKIADATITTNLLTASAYEALVGGDSGSGSGDVTAAGDNVFTGSNAFLGPVSGGEVSASNLTALYVTASNSVLAYGPVISRDGFEVKFPGGEQTAFIADTDGRVEAAGNLSVSNILVRGPASSNQVGWLVNDGENLAMRVGAGQDKVVVPWAEEWPVRLPVGATFGSFGSHVISDAGTRLNGVGLTNGVVYGRCWTNVVLDCASAVQEFTLTERMRTTILKSNATYNALIYANGATNTIVGSLVWVDCQPIGTTNWVIRW